VGAGLIPEKDRAFQSLEIEGTREIHEPSQPPPFLQRGGI